MREEIGPDRDLMADANQVWDVPEAISWTDGLAEFRLRWIEEPTSPDDVLGHAAIRRALAPRGIGVATGEHCANRVVFKQLLQAEAIDYCQVDACRLGGLNEVLAVLLLAARFGVPVCPHAGGLGLCEYVQHISVLDYIVVSGSLDGRMVEFADHCHEHFVHPAQVRGGRYVVPTAPGYSAEMLPESLARSRTPEVPNGSAEGPADLAARAGRHRPRQHVPRHRRRDRRRHRRRRVGRRDPSVRHRAALRARALGASPRSRAGRGGRATSSCCRPRWAGSWNPGAGEETTFVDLPDVHPEFDYSAAATRRSLEDEPRASRPRPRRRACSCTIPTTTKPRRAAGALPELIRMRDEGLVRAIGTGMNQAEMPARFVADFDIDCVLLAGRYTLLEQRRAPRAPRHVRDPRRRRDDRRCVQQRAPRRPAPGRRHLRVLARGARSSSNGPEQHRGGVSPLRGRARRRRRCSSRSPIPRWQRCSPAPVRPTRSARTRRCAQRPIPTELWAALAAEGLLDPVAPSGLTRTSASFPASIPST